MKRIIESAAVDKRKSNRCSKDQNTDNDTNVIQSLEFLGHIPGSLLVLAKASKLHGIRDDVNPVHATEDKRNQNC